MAHERRELDRADLARVRHVRRAAGADIIALDGDNAYILFQVELAAVLHVRQLLRCRVLCPDRHIAVHCLICQLLDVHELRPCELAAIIHRDRVFPEVEANVVKSVFLMDQPGDNMLARVALHAPEALRPVDLAAHLRTGCERRVRIVHDRIRQQLHIQNARAAEHTGIGRLTAALREKHRLIEHDGIARPVRVAAQHGRRKITPVTVEII